MRLFFGIYPPSSVRAEAAAIRDRAHVQIGGDGVRWVSDEQLHLTLQFLGEQSEERAARAREIARESARRAVVAHVSLESLGAFPTAKRPHVLWLGVSGDTAPLIALAEDLGRTLVGDGFAIEARAYHPHVTLARIKGASGGRKTSQLLASGEPARTAPFAIDGFVLLESKPGPHGSEYREIERFSLGG